jgi:hypothetical protein
MTALAIGQEGRPKTVEEPPPRYGVVYKGKIFVQSSPKEALGSLIEAADKGHYNYIVAHLLEPAYIDARIADRAKQFEPSVEANLAALRDFQQRNLDKVPRESRVPTEADKFRERVIADSKTAGFKQLVKDVQEKFTEDPETLRAMRAFRSGGMFPDEKAAGDTARISIPEIKDRFLFLKKVNDRWYIENRQVDAAEPPMKDMKEPEKK